MKKKVDEKSLKNIIELRQAELLDDAEMVKYIHRYMNKLGNANENSDNLHYNVPAMSKKQIEENDQSAVIMFFEAYKSGTIAYDGWAEYILRLLGHWITKKVRDFGVDPNDYEDMSQTCQEVILQHLPKYDPTKGTPPIGFFIKYVEDAIRETQTKIKTSGAVTRHYSAVQHQLNKIAKENGYVDMFDENLSPIKLSVLSNVPLSTIKACIERCTLGKTSTFDEAYQSTQRTESPEQVFLVNERALTIKGYLDKYASDFERFLIEAAIMNDGDGYFRIREDLMAEKETKAKMTGREVKNINNLTYRQISQWLQKNRDYVEAAFPNEKIKFTDGDIRRRVYQTLNAIKNSDMGERIEHDYIPKDSIRQAEDEDIFAAIIGDVVNID